jgi:Rod binding domain-containing protein
MEALFATMLVKELRSTLPNQGFFGSGPGADTFNGMLDEQIGEQLANRGALDIAGRVKVALMNARQNSEQASPKMREVGV